MLRFAAVTVAVLLAGPAWAGCYHYSGEGAYEPTQVAPRVKICFQGACEETAIEYNCGNAYSAITAFENGWAVAVSMDDGTGRAGLPDGVKEQRVVRRDGKDVLDLKSFSCREIDDGDACHLFTF